MCQRPYKNHRFEIDKEVMVSAKLEPSQEDEIILYNNSHIHDPGLCDNLIYSVLIYPGDNNLQAA